MGEFSPARFPAKISPMTVDELRTTLSESAPPASLSPLLIALWWDAKGDWDKAHNIADEVGTRDAAWVHAYLHRKEGDAGNTGYWYRQAGRPHSQLSLEAEWSELAAYLLQP
jgi:hypothetical protein